MASPFMCMNVASGSVDAVSLFGICLSEELFLCRFQQVVNVCNVVVVIAEIKLELIHIDTFLVLDSEYALVVEHEAYAAACSE